MYRPEVNQSDYIEFNTGHYTVGCHFAGEAQGLVESTGRASNGREKRATTPLRIAVLETVRAKRTETTYFKRMQGKKTRKRNQITG